MGKPERGMGLTKKQFAFESDSAGHTIKLLIGTSTVARSIRLFLGTNLYGSLFLQVQLPLTYEQHLNTAPSPS